MGARELNCLFRWNTNCLFKWNTNLQRGIEKILYPSDEGGFLTGIFKMSMVNEHSLRHSHESIGMTLSHTEDLMPVR